MCARHQRARAGCRRQRAWTAATHHSTLQLVLKLLVHGKRDGGARTVAIRLLKALLDILQELKGNAPLLVLVRQTQVSDTVLHHIVVEKPAASEEPRACIVTRHRSDPMRTPADCPEGGAASGRARGPRQGRATQQTVYKVHDSRAASAARRARGRPSGQRGVTHLSYTTDILLSSPPISLSSTRVTVGKLPLRAVYSARTVLPRATRA
jgi:hypothetical protein